MAVERPEIVTDEHLEYLDSLRESEETNMFAAGVFLQKRFIDLVERKDAKTVLQYWMDSFGARKGEKSK